MKYRYRCKICEREFISVYEFQNTCVPCFNKYLKNHKQGDKKMKITKDWENQFKANTDKHFIVNTKTWENQFRDGE